MKKSVIFALFLAVVVSCLVVDSVEGFPDPFTAPSPRPGKKSFRKEVRNTKQYFVKHEIVVF